LFSKKEGDKEKTEECTMERRKGEKNGMKKGNGRETRSKERVNITSNLHYNELPGSNKTFRTTCSVCITLPYIRDSSIFFFVFHSGRL
jgi:hypothetical protein